MCQLCLQINYVLIETERVTKFKGVHQWIPQISSLLSNLQEEMYTLLSLLSPSIAVIPVTCRLNDYTHTGPQTYVVEA